MIPCFWLQKFKQHLPNVTLWKSKKDFSTLCVSKWSMSNLPSKKWLTCLAPVAPGLLRRRAFYVNLVVNVHRPIQNEFFCHAALLPPRFDVFASAFSWATNLWNTPFKTDLCNILFQRFGPLDLFLIVGINCSLGFTTLDQ